MRRATIIAATMMMLCCASAAFAVTPTATLTPTPLATPTPAPNCQQNLGPDFCAPLAHSTVGQVVSGGGVAANGTEQATTWTSTYGSIDFSGALGGLTSTAGATLLQACKVAPAAGHFTQLVIVTDLNGGACTTAPTFNVRDTSGTPASGTALTGSTSAGEVAQSQTLVFSASDVVCITRTINGGTCTAPIFAIEAQVSYP